MVFQKPLQNLKVEEGSTASLQCELSVPDAAVVWSKGGLELQADARREPRQQGCAAELLLRDVRREDAGEYSCTCGSQSTNATLVVTGRCPRLANNSSVWGPAVGGTVFTLTLTVAALFHGSQPGELIRMGGPEVCLPHQ